MCAGKGDCANGKGGLNCPIEEHTPLDEVEVEGELAEEYNDSIISMNKCAKRLISTLEIVSIEPTQAQVNEINTNSTQHSNATVMPQPIVDKFNGDVSLWQEVWRQYETDIHSNQAL